jgi:hypothetical protein
MDCDGRGGRAMIGLIIAVVLGILLIGLVLKLLKFAIIVALVVGGLMLLQNKFGQKNNSGRLK